VTSYVSIILGIFKIAIKHELYQKQMCAIGGNVERIQLPGEQTHFSTPGVSALMYLAWVKDRVAGKPVKNACPR
jgi:hypothetical protein